MSDLISREAKAIEQDKQVPSFAWALIMETAASFEVASYSISDADAKKSAEGAIKYARDTANKYYTTKQQSQEQDELVNKAVADALEEAAKICDDYANSNFGSLVDSGQNGAYVCSKAIRALIKRNVKG